MAKKARRKLEEEDETKSFQFPDFDLDAFLTHEFDISKATIVAIGLALLLGFVTFGIDRLLGGASPLGFLAPLVGILGLAASPYAIQSILRSTDQFTKGDWAGLIALELFGWLALWFVLLDVFRF